MKIAGLLHDSIVDGPGLRFVVFTQGCIIRCKGCHNKNTWDTDGGAEVPVEYIIEEMLSNPLIDGLTLSGGEPFLQAKDCASLATVARQNGLNVWVYTGKTFEELLIDAKENNEIHKLLVFTDVLVDGQYIASGRTLTLKWRGSDNQRVLDVEKSLKTGNGVLYDECKG